MPITSNGEIEYSIPENIKKELDYEFCKQFIKEVHLIWNLSLQDFCDDSLFYMEGTSGWYEAFSSTCRRLHKEELYKYYLSLEWYDSDLFDDELAQIIADYKLILPDEEIKEVARQNNIDPDSIALCDSCGKYFLLKDVVPTKDEEGDIISAECLNCKEDKEIASLPINYEEAIKYHLELTEKDYFKCEKCGNIHPISYKGKKYCVHCEENDLENSLTNKYYNEQIKENEKYHDSIIPTHFEYNGYQTDMVYSYEDDLWYGRVLPLKNPKEFRDMVSFHSLTRKDMEKEFKEAVDDYLDFKKEIEKERPQESSQ